MRAINNYIEHSLQNRLKDDSLRELSANTSLKDFYSNDYLGFASSGKLKKLIFDAIDEGLYRNGSGGSRLIAGNDLFTEELEDEIARYHGSESAILFNSGYDANVGLFSSVAQRGDTVVADELIHASVIDGIRLSNATRFSFKHNDAQSLEEKLKHAKGKLFVAIESIYSMDGDAAPLHEIFEVAERYDAAVIIDEAHAGGIYGPNGEGLIYQSGLHQRAFARLITYGKAFGCHGAAVIGAENLKKYLINFARSFIYTTAAPFYNLISIKMAYRMLADKSYVELLRENISYFIEQAKGLGALIPSSSSIQCILVEGNSRARHLAAYLQREGFNAKAIVNPTVKKNQERIRICLHSFNTKSDICTLITHVKENI